MIHIRYLLFIACMLFSYLLCGQIPNDYGYATYKKKYPKESYIILDLNVEDVIDIENNELKIYSNYSEKILCLDNRTVGIRDRSIHYDQFSSLEEVEAYSLYPKNGKYKKEKVKEFTDEDVIVDGISFYSGAKEKQYQYGNLREGMVVSLKYKRIFNDPHLLHDRSFSKHLYKERQIYTLKVHKNVDLGLHEFYINPNEIKYTKREEGNYVFHVWEMKQVEKGVIYGNEYYALHYEPHLIPYIKSYEINGKKINVFRNLDDLYAWYSSLIQQVKPASNKSLKMLADSLTTKSSTDLEKVKAIYYWVQDNVKYIAFSDGYGGFVPRDPDLTFSRRFGDCKDMSTLIIGLLEQVDIPAYYTWVGTRKIPYSYSQVATPSVDNHMIATYISENGDKYFLDATNPNLAFGRPSSAIQGKEVLISKSISDYELDTIAILQPKESIEVDSAFIKIEEDKLVGNGIIAFTGYLVEGVYREIKELDQDERDKYVKKVFPKGSNKFLAKNVDFKVSEKNQKDSLWITYDFEIDSYLQQLENSIYLNLNLTKHIKHYEIDEKQNVPLFFDYNNQLKKVFVLEIPTGYEVKLLPDNFEVDNKILKAGIYYTQHKGYVYYTFDFTQKQTSVSVNEFEIWNKSINELSQKIDQNIKLTKTHANEN